jgi:acid phosphatase (class A)
MSMKPKLSLTNDTLRNHPLAPILLLWLIAAWPLWASDRYLEPGHPDAVALLAPPPEASSEEEAADLQLTREAVKGRTSAQTATAVEDMKLNLFNFAQAIGPIFQPGKFPKTEALLAKVRKETSAVVNAAKEYWKRPRPSAMDPSLAFGKSEASFSYPSGHSSIGTVQALVLAELFPEKREPILALGRRIGWNRVLTGYHFLTDVRAGRVLGQAIVRELMANPAFQHDLADAKAEIAAAKQAP